MPKKAILKLIPEQEHVLTMIHDYMLESGASPTVEQIQEWLGACSRTTLHSHLAELFEQKMIEWQPDGQSIRLGLKWFKRWVESLSEVELQVLIPILKD